jgi:hypothetical protein
MFCFNSFGSSRLHSILWRKEKVGKMKNHCCILILYGLQDVYEIILLGTTVAFFVCEGVRHVTSIYKFL